MTDHFSLTMRHADGETATAASANFDELVAFLKQYEVCGSELLELIRVEGPPPEVLGVAIPTAGEGWVELPAPVHAPARPFVTVEEYLAARADNADDLRIPRRPDILFPRSRSLQRVCGA